MAVAQSTPDQDDLLASVVRITELRDRDTLGSSLVSTLQELLEARTVGLYQAISDHSGRRLLHLTALAGEAPARKGGHAGLLRLEQVPDHDRCLQADAKVQGEGGRLLYPVHDGNAKASGIPSLA